MKFYVGLHHPADAQHFDTCFISVNVLRKRKGPFRVRGTWILDSGAYSEISVHGRYRDSVEEYARQIRKWRNNGMLLAAVSQDYMCESHILAKTGLSIPEHQRLTVERYDELHAANTGVYIMPVLQGYAPEDYVRHIRMYGSRLASGAWVGVGSVCKRNGDARAIEAVLTAIKKERPDLLLHGFGIKTTALRSELVRRLLHTADSMAWSFAARRQGRDANDWHEADKFRERIDALIALDDIAAFDATMHAAAVQWQLIVALDEAMHAAFLHHQETFT